MFDPEELARAGVQSRANGYADWRFPQYPFRIKSRSRFGTWNYKNGESVRLILLAQRANK